jgi:3-dehydroquinate synthase
LRGIEVVHIPTTLLGAVDAAIGGKTGVNLRGKNLVGAFHHPSRVVVDLTVLESLPLPLKQEGLVEALKAGLIADPELVSLIETAGLDCELSEVVPRAVAVKVRVVEEDFKETGIRAILNYGHTIGHAVEIAGNLPHGHAVALGMAAAGRIAEEVVGFGGLARQNDALTGLGLPLQSPGIARATVLEILARDKKRDASGIRMVLLPVIGRAVVRTVSGPTIDTGLAGIGIA